MIPNYLNINVQNGGVINKIAITWETLLFKRLNLPHTIKGANPNTLVKTKVPPPPLLIKANP